MSKYLIFKNPENPEILGKFIDYSQAEKLLIDLYEVSKVSFNWNNTLREGYSKVKKCEVSQVEYSDIEDWSGIYWIVNAQDIMSKVEYEAGPAIKYHTVKCTIFKCLCGNR